MHSPVMRTKNCCCKAVGLPAWRRFCFYLLFAVRHATIWWAIRWYYLLPVWGGSSAKRWISMWEDQPNSIGNLPFDVLNSINLREDGWMTSSPIWFAAAAHSYKIAKKWRSEPQTYDWIISCSDNNSKSSITTLLPHNTWTMAISNLDYRIFIL